ncbi:MAG TPA: hypothetical protein PK536_03605 [Ignavibacteria bacterium]|nr:hypothetical protein [Ignavibacteria bacterium]HRK00578.1 hypothetical protein [Ignavibacteria bacterium]
MKESRLDYSVSINAPADMFSDKLFIERRTARLKNLKEISGN